MVNLTATARGRPAGSPEGNLQGSVRGMGWSMTTAGGLPRDAGQGFGFAVNGDEGRSSAEGWGLGRGVVCEAVEVVSHADVRRWLAGDWGLSCAEGETVEVLAEEAVVLVP
jgi:hypothetical protein